MSKNPTYEELEQRIRELEKAEFKYKQTEEKLMKSAEMLDTVMDGVSTLITYIDRGERYMYVNRAYTEWYGVTRKELNGKRVADVLGPDVYERASYNIKKALCGDRVSYTNNVIAKDGTERYVSVNYDPHYSGGEVKGFFSSIADITERKRLEEERDGLIAKLKKALSEVKTLRGFLPICSHCKKIRDDKGYWNQIESYIHKHSDAEFSHGICPECAKKYYPDMVLYDEGQDQE